MNDIPKIQNEAPQTDLLRASNVAYADAKRLHAFQTFLSVVVPLAGSVSTLVLPSMRGLVAIVSLTIAVADPTLLDRLQRTIRRAAAKIQEQFDCVVLDVPWDKFAVGSRLEPEEIHGYVLRHPPSADAARLKDWYPPAVGNVPINAGRVICQRTNLWYDAKLRRTYAGWVLGILLLACVGLVLAGFCLNLTVEALILSAVAPATPILMFALREFYRQRDAADLLDKLRGEADALWSRLIKGDCTGEECAVLSRQFQSALFEHRRTSPLIFEWIYRRMRSGLEGQMQHGAESYVKQFLDAEGKRPSKG